MVKNILNCVNFKRTNTYVLYQLTPIVLGLNKLLKQIVCHSEDPHRLKILC